MTDEEYEYPEFIVKLNLEFNAIRVMDNRLIPTTWKAVVEVIYDIEDVYEDDDPTFDIEVKTTIAKINYWLDNFISGSLLFDRSNEWAITSFFDENGHTTVGNHIVVLPDEPTDDIIAQILHSKLNAFAGDHMVFGVVELTSDDESGLSFMFTGVGESNLPMMHDWIGEHTYFDKPWWARDDASTVDVIPAPDADLSEKPVSAVSLDFIRQTFAPHDKQDAVIVRPDFKPQVIDGGLKE